MQGTEENAARQLEAESLRSQIAVGWITNLLVLTVMLAFMITTSLLTEVDTGFRSLRYDPGRAGMRMLTYIVALYALMPVYVALVGGLRSRAWRWLGVAAAAFGFVFLVLHHLAHWRAGQRPDFNSHVLDLTLHLVGIWVLVNSIRWAKRAAIRA